MIDQRMLGSLSRVAFAPVRRSGGLILVFHQISADKFIRWMSYVERYFELVSLDHLVQLRESGRSLAGLLAVTFDDGWRDTCVAVSGICEERRWPATIYVPTAILQENARFWFSELPDLVEVAAGQCMEIDDFLLDLSNQATTRDTLGTLRAALSTLPGDEAVEVVGALRAAGELTAPNPSPPRFIDRSFLEEFSSSQWISFGSHTVDHQSLASQPEDSVRHQLSRSQAQLEEILGYRVTHFCYPYGSAAAIGPVAPKIVAEYYRSATTMVRGRCSAASSLTYLPRIPLYEKDTTSRVAAKLAVAPWF